MRWGNRRRTRSGGGCARRPVRRGGAGSLRRPCPVPQDRGPGRDRPPRDTGGFLMTSADDRALEYHLHAVADRVKDEFEGVLSQETIDGSITKDMPEVLFV